MNTVNITEQKRTFVNDLQNAKGYENTDWQDFAERAHKLQITDAEIKAITAELTQEWCEMCEQNFVDLSTEMQLCSECYGENR